jgi:hypothetical protein
LFRITQQAAIDRLPGRIRYRTNIRLQRRFPGREIHRQTGKALKRCRVQQMKRQFFVTQLSVLLEQRTTQHRFCGHPPSPGGLYRCQSQIFGHPFQHLDVGIQPRGHARQFAPDVVLGKLIEYTDLGRAFGTHFPLRGFVFLL